MIITVFNSSCEFQSVQKGFKNNKPHTHKSKNKNLNNCLVFMCTSNGILF